MNAGELDRLDALYAAMTQGQWCNFVGSNISVAGRYLDVIDKDDARGIVALHNSYPALSAALRAAWAELEAVKESESMLDSCADMYQSRAFAVEARVKELEAELATDKETCFGAIEETNRIHLAISESLAARLAKAEELLRPFATWARNIAELDPVAQTAYAAAATFLACTEPAK